MNYFKNIFLVLSALIILIFTSSCGRDANASSKKNDKVREYAVLTVSPNPITLNIEYPATIQGQQNVEIHARVDGFIDHIYMDEGSFVHKGQVLFVLDDRQYRQNIASAEANVKVAEADVSTAELQVEKVKRLVDKSIISPFDLQSAELTLKSKQALLAQSQANLQNAKTNLSYTRITSPSNGMIGTIPYKLGSLVGPSSTQPLTMVSDIGNIFAYFSINEKDFLTLTREHGGNAIKKSIDELPEVSLVLADKTVYPIKGKIETVNGLIDIQTGSANFRAVFKNPDGAIRSGSSATVRIPTIIDDALLVPQKATYELQNKRFVYVVDGNGKVTNTEIQVTPISDGQFYVVTDGLKAGDQIVNEGINSLKDGINIKPVIANKDSIYSRLKNN
jgi:membrane fusion protein (multidrug efflux system)